MSIMDPIDYFDDMFNGPYSLFRSSTTSRKKVNLTRDGSLKLQFDLPGVDSKHISVRSVDGYLDVTAEVDGEKRTWRHSIEKRFAVDNATATYQHGRLTVVIPLASEPEGKIIPVTVS